MISKSAVLHYVQRKYQTEPDYPWFKYPDYAVLRHQKNRKWFGVLMMVPKSRLGLLGDEQIAVLNLKCDVMLASLIERPEIMPAYHMNKRHWITVRLGGKLPDSDLFKLIDLSYELTR